MFIARDRNKHTQIVLMFPEIPRIATWKRATISGRCRDNPVLPSGVIWSQLFACLVRMIGPEDRLSKKTMGALIYQSAA
jgi:hypothetical protein